MAKQYLDHDPVSGIAHWVDTDEETGITSYGAEQSAESVAAILDANQEMYNSAPTKWGELAMVGRIPMVQFAELVSRGFIGPEGGQVAEEHKEEVKKILRKTLNDIDYRKLRTRPGTI